MLSDIRREKLEGFIKESNVRISPGGGSGGFNSMPLRSMGVGGAGGSGGGASPPIPGYGSGGPVKKDGYLTDKKGKRYAKVHRGEQVVPKRKTASDLKGLLLEKLARLKGMVTKSALGFVHGTKGVARTSKASLKRLRKQPGIQQGAM